MIEAIAKANEATENEFTENSSYKSVIKSVNEVLCRKYKF